MKKKISISISMETFEVVKSNVDGNTFRNSSHFIEYAINRLMEEDETFKSHKNSPVIDEDREFLGHKKLSASSCKDKMQRSGKWSGK